MHLLLTYVPTIAGGLFKITLKCDTQGLRQTGRQSTLRELISFSQYLSENHYLLDTLLARHNFSK